MGRCTIDHTLQDVQQKLADQSAFIPHELAIKVGDALTAGAEQAFLNDVFHLLKKYDLADEKEREERNAKLDSLVR
jgi:hypothetical protein